MKQVILILSICVANIAFSQSTIDHSKSESGLEELLKESKIVGAAAAYSAQGKTLWTMAKGYACKDDKVLFTEKTITRSASIAKPITAVAILQLHEKGLIDLDAIVQTYIPDYPTHEEGDITIRHLLGHTSGIGGYQSSKEAESKVEYSSLKEATSVFKNRQLQFKPGSKYGYTTYGYVVLGRVIEEVTGETYEDYVERNIFEKVGMHNSGVEHYDEVYENKSCLYHKKRRKAKEVDKNNLSNRLPGGGFYTTVEDMLKFGNAVVSHKLIKEETFNMMIERQYLREDGNSYALGWFVYSGSTPEDIIIGHSGELTGASNQLFIIPGKQAVIVTLSNTSLTWKAVANYTGGLIGIMNDGNFGNN